MGSSGAAEGHGEDQTSSTTQFCLDLPRVKQPGIISRPHTRRALSGGRSPLTSRRGCYRLSKPSVVRFTLKETLNSSSLFFPQIVSLL